ncbi:MAG: MerR family transcriptional regulator [Acidobacteria bacterium]|nr:MerR family transcriptional regulator [Acidobacteriota bacterium]
MTTALFPPREAAAQTGLSLDTLRYYEREGLVGPIRRTAGRRAYTEGDIAWIGLLSCLRDAGLGIADLRAFTALLHSVDPAVDRVGFLRARREELRDRVAAITAAITVLDHKISRFEEEHG